MAGRGKEFEAAILERAAYYERKRYMTLRKVDPPTIFVRGHILYRRSPFLDYVGSLIEQQGRSVFLEAKETHEDKLGLEAKSNGVTRNQLHSLRMWHCSNAVAAVIWKCPSGVYLLPVTLLDALADKTQRKHVKATDIPRQCRCDSRGTLGIMSAIRRLFPKTP